MLEEMLGQLGVDVTRLNVALTLPSNEAIRAAVMSGGYAAGLSELVAGPYIAARLLAKAGVALTTRDFFLLRHRERYRSKAAIAFEGMIRQAG
jgi:DNA-binding transcriptional LysR family regulator